MTREEKNNIKLEKAKNKEKFKKVNLVTGILLGMYLTISGYLIYNLYRLTDIENLIRYSVIAISILFDIFLAIKYLKMRRKPLKRKYFAFIFTILLLGAAQYFVSYTIDKGLSVVDNISVKKVKTYSTSLITLNTSTLSSVSDITGDTKIGRISDKNNIEGYVLTKEIIKKDKIDKKLIEDYDDTITMLYDLYEGKIDAAFVSSSYADLYSGMEKFENISTEVTVLDKYSKKMKIRKETETIASTKSVTEPFTILLMGVDSTSEDLSKVSGLGDSLMLITFNPNTLNATIISIPRDTFVPISCYGNRRSKITHAASGGDKCMINTIQNTFDVNIDYYAKINFRGLIKLVDALGGVDVDVPYAFCETDENRLLKNTVYVDKGMQHLNGVQALALSRNRKTYPTCGAKWNKGDRNDFVRGQNQQLVINAIINKAKSMTSVSQFYNLLDAVGNSMTTNMDRKQILSFYNVFKNVIINSKDLTDDNDIINLQKMYLNGTGGLYQDGIMNMPLYEYIPYQKSLNAIKNAMKVNLELKEEKPATTFSFSADEEYEQEVIGKNVSGGADIPKAATPTTTTTTEENKCGENEELGADKTTCVCKWGYKKNSSGVCTKEEEEKKTEDTTEKCINATGTPGNCQCWKGYKETSDPNKCELDSESGGTQNGGNSDNTGTNSGQTGGNSGNTGTNSGQTGGNSGDSGDKTGPAEGENGI